MNEYADRIAEDRRLAILILLEGAPGYLGNEALLHSSLPDLGHRPSEAQIRTDLAWLQEQGLLRTRDLRGLMLAELEPRGVDVATGRATVPGVKRRRPG